MAFWLDSHCRPHITCIDWLFGQFIHVVILSDLNHHVAGVAAVEHLPEVVREGVRFIVFFEGHVIVVHFVPVYALDGPLDVNLIGDVSVFDGAGHGTLEGYEITPLLNPPGADQKVCQAAVNVDQSVVILK